MIKVMCCCLATLFVSFIDVNASSFFDRAIEYVDENFGDDSFSDYDDDQYYDNGRSGRRSYDNGYNDRRYNNSNGRRNQNFSDRNSFRSSSFSSNGTFVKDVCISPDGTRLARILKKGNLEDIVVRSSDNQDKTVLHSTVAIDSLKFVGRNFLICTFRNGSNYCRLRIINLENGKSHEMIPLNRAIHINIIPSMLDETACSVSYDGKKYFVHEIDVRNARLQRLVESFIPPVLDNHVEPRIFYKRSNASLGDKSGFDVFGIAEGENSSNAQQIDHITEPSKEMFASVSGNTCYKLSIHNNELEIKQMSLLDNTETSNTVKNVARLNDCRVSLGADGDLYFVTVGNRGKNIRNVPIAKEAENDIKFINSKLRNIPWYRISSNADNNMWILRSSSQPNRHFLYDAAAQKITEIHVFDKNIELATEEDVMPFGVHMS